MRNFLMIIIAGAVLYSCKSKGNDKDQPDKKVEKVEKTEYTVTKDGIGDIKIGMRDSELEKLLNQKFKFGMDRDSVGYWEDTVKTKYKDIDISLYFQREYGDSDSTFMTLSGVETSSPLCKTEYGVGIGDDKMAILQPYDDRPIDMGPDYEQVNDSTWLPSKIKYTINVKDTGWARELIFHLVNKKCASLGSGIIMGD